MNTTWIAVVTLALGLTACTTAPNSYRANSSLDPADYTVECAGDFDQPPRLLAGKVPVFPANMLNPTLIDDRKVRRLPMK